MTVHADVISARRDLGLRPNTVVATILTYGSRIGLFRRSAHVTGDAGRWHCITGFLPACADPLRQALLEVEEEAGILEPELELKRRTVLYLTGADGRRWQVHVFHFQSATEHVKLNWEHDASCWARRDQLRKLPTVAWFSNVLESVTEMVPEAPREHERESPR
jgi:hypothetical protein